MIKNESELANVLGMAFAAYANRVQNGLVHAYKGLLEYNSVDVILTVTAEGGITAKPSPQIEKREWIDNKPTGEAEGVIISDPVQNISPVLEEQPKPKKKRVSRKKVNAETTN